MYEPNYSTPLHHDCTINTFGLGIFDSFVSSVEVDALFVVALAPVDFCSCTLVARAVSASATCGCCLGVIGSGCCSLALVVAAVRV